MSSSFVRGSLALHAAALPALAAFPSRWEWVAGTLVANHAAIVSASLAPRSALLGANLTRDDAAARAGAIALTFDDGPDPEVTPRVLDLLDAAGASASFFCIGERVDRAPSLAREIGRRGHRLENHTHSHSASFYFHSPATLEREILLCQRAIADATGRAPVLFRAPAGVRSPLLQPALERAGLTLCSWTRRAFDTVRRDPAAICAALTRGLQPGDVLVLHDGAAHDRPGRAGVLLDALPRLLEAISARGLAIVPVSR
jgi:peptidoglycan/xylan/chitin deacetylase (PgdA/CDA1 family)